MTPITAITNLIDEKYIQLGFAGFCLILIALVVWLIKTHNKINSDQNKALVDVIQKNNKVLAKVFDGLNSIKESEDQLKYSIERLSTESNCSTKEISEKLNELQTVLKCRPCIKKEMSHAG
jgi:uncharacterized coiled-coil DUF342 family protein